MKFLKPTFATFLLCAVGMARAAPAATGEETLRLGVLPFMPTLVVFKRFGPLRELLTERLGRPVELKTAPDFQAFVQRTNAQAYDIVWTAPHFALLAAEQDKYEVLATWNKQAVGMVLVREDSPVTKPEQLAGRMVATPAASAIVTLLAKEHLAKLGLRGDRAPRFSATPDHLTSRAAVLYGDADAAIVGRQIALDAQAKELPLRVLATTAGVPGVAVLASTRLPRPLRERIRQELIQLAGHEQGRTVQAASSLPSYQPAARDDLAPLGRFLTDDIRRLAIEVPVQP